MSPFAPGNDDTPHLERTEPACKYGQGVVIGESTTDGAVVAFKAIPYAAPPVGTLRWAPPAPAPAWSAPLDATTFGHRCFQSDAYSDMIFHDSGASEDCLNLNVWAPATAKPNSSHGLPVMVWVYGGGYLTGGTSERRQMASFSHSATSLL